MHFVKKVEQDKNDVRSNTLYVFSCAGCGEDVFVTDRHIDVTLQRKCPKCGLGDDSNEEGFLLEKKEKIKRQIRDLTEELEKLQSRIVAVQTIRETAAGSPTLTKESV